MKGEWLVPHHFLLVVLESSVKMIQACKFLGLTENSRITDLEPDFQKSSSKGLMDDCIYHFLLKNQLIFY